MNSTVQKYIDQLESKGVQLGDREKMLFNYGFQCGMNHSILVHTDAINDFMDEMIEEDKENGSI